MNPKIASNVCKEKKNLLTKASEWTVKNKINNLIIWQWMQSGILQSCLVINDLSGYKVK